ncbi:MAG TPA: alkaline phosphatase family protein [Thermoanaerobaculia bacterium]|nr:alkaline phosphatase family protein [Thermoanaerobaculia bacterium]
MRGPRHLSLPAVLAALFLAVSCRTAPAPPPLATPPAGAGRVILISLDGASAVELHRRHRAGELEAGGFSRFFDEGQVASSLTPVDPTLTAVNHISLATGFPPATTGIVSNNFHPSGTPWGERASGFAAPIGTETLWEAVRRQGKRSGVWTFPGADDTGPRRRGDWGFTYAGKGYPSEVAADLARRGLIWPGPPDGDALEATWEGKPGIDLATWTDQAVRFGDFFYDGLAYAASRPDWDLLLGYVPTIDEAGHELLLEEPRQPGFSPERRDAFAAARTKVWQGADRGLARLLKSVDLSTTTVLIVSDHGMTPVFARIDPNALLRDAGYAKLGPDGRVDPAASKALAISNGGVSHVYLAPGVPPDEREKILADLSGRFADLEVQGQRAIDKVFSHGQLGPIGLDHPNSGDLVLFAASGILFAEKPIPEGAIIAPTDVYGMHGHLYQAGSGDRRLAGIYLALGRGVRKQPLGEVKNTDVARRAAAYLGIEPPRRLADPQSP